LKKNKNDSIKPWLLRYGITYDDDLNPIEGYTALATVWASWRRASARETLAAAEVNAAATDVFEIRYSSTVSELNPKDRLRYQGNDYDIQAVAEIGRREGLRIDASKRADDRQANAFDFRITDNSQYLPLLAEAN
jgi:SPP1 family predicted phage head-tail adaptor